MGGSPGVTLGPVLAPLLALLLTSSGWAAPGAGTLPASMAPQLRFRELGVRDGLSEGWVVQVLQDRVGALWFATMNGLNRYDGYQVRSFRHRPGEPDSLRHNYLLGLALDGAGDLWVGSFAGLDRLREDGRSFERLHHDPQDPAGLPGDRIGWVTAGRDGRIWVNTKAGLVWRKPGNPRFHRFDREASGLPEGWIRVLADDPDGGQWLGLDPGVLAHRAAGETRFTTQAVGEAPAQITTLLPARGGGVWVGTRKGLFRSHPGEAAAQPVGLSEPPPQVWSLLEDREGTLWVGTQDQGLVRLHPPSGAVAHSRHRPGDPRSLAHDAVWDLGEDHSGVVWVATSRGLNHWDPHLAAFEVHAARPGGDEGDLAWGNINGVAETPDGALWLATDGGGLQRWDPASGSFRAYRHDPDDPTSLPTDDLTSLMADRHGDVWVGSQRAGLARLAAGGSAFERIPLPQPGTTRNAYITRIFEGRDGQVWISGENGLRRVVRRDPVEVELFQGLPPALAGKTFTASYQDPAGVTWFGTFGEGLARLDPEDGSVRAWRHDPEDPTSLGNDWVMALAGGGDRPLYLATYGGGVARFDPEAETFHHVTSREGLPNDAVFGLVEAGDELWVSSARGLTRLTPGPVEDGQWTCRVRPYTEADGLPIQEYAPEAYMKTRDGRLVFGGRRGFVRFDPAALREPTAPPRVSIDAVRPKRTPGPPGSTLPRHRVWAPPVHLRWWENSGTFEFTGYHYSNPAGLHYRFRLPGFYDAWATGQRRTSFFSGLPPGRHRFEVQAATAFGPWSETASLELVVDAPPWRTPLAYLLYLLTGVGVVAAACWLWTRRQARELDRQRAVNRRLEAVDQLKDRFLANTSHELRTPLHGIIGISEGLRDRDQLPGDARASLGLVVSSARRLASLVDDILDFSRLKSHDLVLRRRPLDLGPLVEVVLALSGPLAKDKGLELRDQLAADLPLVDGDEDRLTQVLFNLVGNAVKFTQQGAVTVGAEARGDQVEVWVRDTGPGIPAEDQARIFESFEQVEGGDDRSHGGTGLGLAITRSLVELHGGQLSVESAPGEGSCFRFTLPKAAEDGGAASQPPPAPRVSAPPAPGDDAGGEPDGGLGAGREAAPSDAPRILVVDDEPVNHEVLRQQLGGRHQLVHVYDGAAALAELEAGEPFDLVLLDLMMPGMSGYEVCREIRKRHLLSDLPVLLLTARGQVADKVEGLSTGANDYLVKPVVADELAARVRTHLDMLRIHEATGRFLPREFLRLLDRDSIIDVELGDQVQREMTVLFSDIRSFTDLSEGMTPEENFAFINRYLSRVAPEIRRHGGFIDKYMGDAIMALFPGPAEDALAAARGMRAALAQLNAELAEEGKPEIRIGVGLHRGTLMLGTIGEARRLEGTVIADAVNLASRLEGLTKRYGATVVISGALRDALEEPGDHQLRFLGRVAVKGKNEPVDLHEVFDGDPPADLARKQQTAGAFAAGLEAFLGGDFAGAVARFREVCDQAPEDPAARLYLERAAALVVSGVDDDWDGVERLDQK